MIVGKRYPNQKDHPLDAAAGTAGGGERQMICEIRKNGQEVVLHHPKLSDVLAMLTLFLFMPEKEIVFTKPEEDEP